MRIVVLLLVYLKDVSVVLAHDLRYLLVNLLIVSLGVLAPLGCLMVVFGVFALERTMSRCRVEARIALFERTEPTLHLMHHHILVIWIVKMVSLLMCMQIGFLVKSLVTSWIGAGEWLFARVNSQVSLQIEVK